VGRRKVSFPEEEEGLDEKGKRRDPKGVFLVGEGLGKKKKQKKGVAFFPRKKIEVKYFFGRLLQLVIKSRKGFLASWWEGFPGEGKKIPLKKSHLELRDQKKLRKAGRRAMFSFEVRKTLWKFWKREVGRGNFPHPMGKTIGVGEGIPLARCLYQLEGKRT